MTSHYLKHTDPVNWAGHSCQILQICLVQLTLADLFTNLFWLPSWLHCSHTYLVLPVFDFFFFYELISPSIEMVVLPTVILREFSKINILIWLSRSEKILWLFKCEWWDLLWHSVNVHSSHFMFGTWMNTSLDRSQTWKEFHLKYVPTGIVTHFQLLSYIS